MRIYEVTDNKRDYMHLLFLADEQENMIDRYLDKGTMYVIDDNGVKGECIVTDEGEGILEIKNIATVPESHGNRELVKWDKEHRELLERIAPEQYEVLHYAALDVLKKK